MILPNKNINLSNSFLGTGFIILQELKSPQTVSSLWEKVRKKSEIGTFEKFSLTLDFIYSIGLISFNGELLTKTKQ